MMSKITQTLSGLFKPQRLEKVASFCAVPALWLSFAFFIMGVYMAFSTPADYQQGDYVRFMYIHVPASWFALFTYTIMASLSLSGYAFKIQTAHLLTRALAIPGCIMCILSLITGSLWGKVTWGTYWVWDARLTSMFILLMIYGGYIILSHKKRLEQLHTLSLFVMIGVVNIPIIKYSVDLWFTLHQPASIMRLAKPAIDSVFLPPLFTMAISYLLYVIALTSRIFLKDLRREKKRQERLMTFHKKSQKKEKAA